MVFRVKFPQTNSISYHLGTVRAVNSPGLFIRTFGGRTQHLCFNKPQVILALKFEKHWNKLCYRAAQNVLTEARSSSSSIRLLALGMLQWPCAARPNEKTVAEESQLRRSPRYSVERIWKPPPDWNLARVTGWRVPLSVASMPVLPNLHCANNPLLVTTGFWFSTSGVGLESLHF